jgi:hypothetical protein
MVAYSFKRRFCEQVTNWEKRQTIRARRGRHARPGERVQLYFGMRTKHCRKLITPDPMVTDVAEIALFIPSDGGLAQITTDPDHPYEVSDWFARQDGFADAADFTAFWLKEHGAGSFAGVLIRWDVAP